MKIGFLGGTFNPIQNAHIQLAKAAQAELELDKVVFVPAGRVDHKEVLDPGPEIRFMMTEMAVNPFGFEVSRQQTDSPLPSRTINHLDALIRDYPADEHFWIIGGDQAVNFPNWLDHDKIIAKIKLAVATRDEYDCKAIFKALAPFKDRFELFNMPPSSVSSTQVRTLIQNGESAEKFVPLSVHEWIIDHLLYA